MTARNSHCPASPNGSHHLLMQWRDMTDGTREYWGVCKWCGDEKKEDENLVMKSVNVLPDGATYFRGKNCELRARGKGARDA